MLDTRIAYSSDGAIFEKALSNLLANLLADGSYYFSLGLVLVNPYSN